jgi:hypothetical protein
MQSNFPISPVLPSGPGHDADVDGIVNLIRRVPLPVQKPASRALPKK